MMTVPYFDRRTVIAGALSSAAAANVLIGGSRLADAQNAKRINVHALSDLTSLDPSFHSNETDEAAYYAVLRKLIRYVSADIYEWELDAAESIEQVDDTHIRFTLHPGIEWTNGYGNLTAEDVKYSYERIANPENESWFAGDWAALDHVDVIDELNGVIVLKTPFAPLWTSTLPHATGSIVCKAAVEEMGGKFEVDMPAQCGPYILDEWLPSEHFRLVRNPNYLGEAASFDEIRVYPIEDPTSAEVAVLAGDLDAAKLSTSSISRFRHDEVPDGLAVLEREAIGYKWIGINVDAPPFDDPRVRKAVQYTIDVPEIIDGAYSGQGEPATGVLAPSLIGHRASKLITGPDVEKARQLLAEAGTGDGFDATMHIINETEALAVAQIVQAQLSQIGINLEILAVDSSVYWNLGNEEVGDDWKTVQLIYQDWGMAPDPYWATSWFTCEQVGVWNWQRFCDDTFDQLNTAAAAELDPVKRNDMYIRMQDLMEESGAFVFLTHGVNGWLYRSDIIPGLYPDGFYVLYQDFSSQT